MSLWRRISAKWGAGAGETDDVRIDGATNSLISVAFAHHAIHEGVAFVAHYENECTNIGEQTVIAFNTPDTTKWVHMVMTGHVTSISRISLVENPSIDVDEGTDLTIYNRNRNSATASTVLSVENPPVAGGATSYNETQAAGANITETTQLDSVVLGSAGLGGAASGSGGSAAGRFEFVLDQNQQYAFIIESLDASDNIHTIDLSWYEHTSLH